jgi:hypothetical protein
MPLARPSALLSTLCLAVALAGCASTTHDRAERLPYEGGTLSLGQQGERCEVALKGAINPDTVRKLSVLLADLDKRGCSRREAALDAGEGSVNAAITLGSMLRNRNFDTVVAEGSACRTACALVFAAGRERILPGNSAAPRIGFAQIPPDQDFGRNTCETELNRAQTLTLGRYLRAMLPAPAADATFQQLASADCRNVRYVSASEALAMGLATRTQR